MRGDTPCQSGVFSYVSAEQRVPQDHPLRTIKRMADKVLYRLEPTFSDMYSNTGRPSIPPEMLLKGQLLIALFSIRSDRMFCETLEYNILFRWFLDMDIDGAVFDHSTYSKNRDRLIQHAVAREFFEEVIAYARTAELLSDEHFTVDGTLIEAWASMKSFKRRDGSDGDRNDISPRNPSVGFRGEKRSNDTHASTSDPEARLARKNKGSGAILSYRGHVLMENRNGLCVDVAITEATGTAEREAALDMIRREHTRGGHRMKTVGADKGYSAGPFIHPLRELGVKPHVAWNEYSRVTGLDGRTTRHESYRVSQRKRKRVEEIFGWFKTIGGLRKTRVRGVQTNQAAAYIVGAAYNLLRMVKLTPTHALAW